MNSVEIHFTQRVYENCRLAVRGKCNPKFLLIILSVFIFTACPEPIEHRDTTIMLEEVFTNCTQTKLRISVIDTTDEWKFDLKRNNQAFKKNKRVYSSDTVIVDRTLEPNTSYTYRAYWKDGFQVIDSSESITITTLDTSSRDFIWEVENLHTPSLGQSNEWNDVAIIEDDNIWVVGFLETDTATYNVARWNGNEWEFILISPQGLLHDIDCIYAFNENDIWFGKAGLPIHWDGETYYKYTPANSTHPGQPTIDNIWGSSPDDIYFIGGDGSIVHYNGSVFEEIDSGTDVDLNSICSKGPNTVFISGYRDSYELRTVLIKIENMETEKILDYELGPPYLPLPNTISGTICKMVSFGNNTLITVGTWGVYHCPYTTTGEGEWQGWDSEPRSLPVDIVGTGINDYFIFTKLTESIHYNGVTHSEFTIPGSRWASAADMKDDLIVIVTWSGNIIKGYRQ